MARNTELEQENALEFEFLNQMPFYHLYTKALESDIIFHSDEERRVAINYIAFASVKAGVRILAYSLMSNHFHFVIRADEQVGRQFFEIMKESLALYFSRHGFPGIMSSVVPCFNEITSLRQLRTEIVYVLRNPFVERTDVNPLSYKWCSGFLYFNEFLEYIPKDPHKDLTYRDKRKVAMTADTTSYPGLECVGLMIAPSSFVDYKMVENYFGNHRKFLMCMFRNIESQVETALRLGEKPSLNDDEAYSLCLKEAKQMYGNSRIKELTELQKNELAKKLKYDYHFSNGQLARCVSLPLTTVNALFPLTAKAVLK